MKQIMVTEPKRVHYERRDVTGRERTERSRRKRKQIKRRKRRAKLLFCAEVVCFVSLLSFLFGKYIGAKESGEKVTVSVKDGDMLSHESGIIETEILEKENSLRVNILLVNKKNRLPSDYKPILLTLPDGVNRAAEEAYEPLCRMLKAGQQAGLLFEICSSYRDVERQQELFDEDIDALMRVGYSYTEAYEEVAKETMPPGHSEHSTGLAFDIVALDYQMLDGGQEDTAENQWLQEHCAEYGFILRYPKGKEEITDINYESWHFRYVGKEAATYIMENDITLEEYLEL